MNYIRLSVTSQTKLSELFNPRNISYDFRSQTDFELGPIYATAYGLRSLKYFAPKIWNVVPIDIRNSGNLSEFTTKIKSWKPVTCPCNLCHTFLGQVGYRLTKVSFNYFVVTEAVTARCWAPCWLFFR